MKHKIGREVYTLGGKPAWSKMKWGKIIAIGDANHYIVKFSDGRKTWVHKENIIFYR